MASTTTTLSGILPTSNWIAYQLIEPCDQTGEDSDEWEDTPEFEPLQEMLADICDDGEEATIVAVDAEWRVSVSKEFISISLAKSFLQAFVTYNTFEGMSSTLEGPCAILDNTSLSQLSCPTSQLDDDCMNVCRKLLHSLFPSPQANTYTLFSTYVLTNHHSPVNDDNHIWRITNHTQYWTKLKRIIPIHHHVTQHWVFALSTMFHNTSNSLVALGWMVEWHSGEYCVPPEAHMMTWFITQDVMTLISRLEHLAIDHRYSLGTQTSGLGWMVSLTCVSPIVTA